MLQSVDLRGHPESGEFPTAATADTLRFAGDIYDDIGEDGLGAEVTTGNSCSSRPPLEGIGYYDSSGADEDDTTLGQDSPLTSTRGCDPPAGSARRTDR